MPGHREHRHIGVAAKKASSALTQDTGGNSKVIRIIGYEP